VHVGAAAAAHGEKADMCISANGGPLRRGMYVIADLVTTDQKLDAV